MISTQPLFIIIAVVPQILNNLSENMQADVNSLFSFKYTVNIMWEVIVNISQGKTFMIFVKTYPISVKYTTTKEKKTSNYPDENFGKFISIDSSFPIIQSHGI